MTTTLKKVFLGAAAKIHTIHPALVLPLVGIGAWLIAPALVMGDADKAGAGDQIVTTGSAAAGEKPADAGAQPQYAPVAAVMPAPAVAAAPAAGGGFWSGLAGLFGRGESSGGDGGGGDRGGSGGGNSPRSKPPGQQQSRLAARTPHPETGAAGAHGATPPGLAQSKPPAGSNTSPAVTMPKQATPPNTLPMGALPRPMPPQGAAPMVAMPRPIPPAVHHPWRLRRGPPCRRRLRQWSCNPLRRR
jgi:hypothetical protein